jgi:hypothetical protein
MRMQRMAAPSAAVLGSVLLTAAAAGGAPAAPAAGGGYLPVRGILRSVTAVSARRAWVVGDNLRDHALIAGWNGTRWRLERLPGSRSSWAWRPCPRAAPGPLAGTGTPGTRGP